MSNLLTSGIQHTLVDNFPTIYSTTVGNFPASQTVAGTVSSTQGTTPWLVANNPGQTLAVSGVVTAVSGTQNVHVDNWPTTQGVAVQNFPATQAITGTVNATQGTTPWLVANNPGQTLAISGVVTAISGTQNVHVDNWPLVQSVSVPAGVNVNNFPASQAVTIVSGTSNINVGNFPTIQEVYVVNQASNSANVNVTNASLAVTQSTSPWTVSGVVSYPSLPTSSVTWTSGTSQNTANTIALGGSQGVTVTINSATISSGAVFFEVSTDGVNWISQQMAQSNIQVPLQLFSFSNASGGAFTAPVGGYNFFRVRLSTVLGGAGSATINVQAMPVPPSLGAIVALVQSNAASNFLTQTSNIPGLTLAVSGVINSIATGQGRTLQFAPIVTSAAGQTSVVSALAGVATKVVSYVIVSSGVTNVIFQNGSTALTGVMSIAANGGISAQGQVSSHLFQTSTNTALNIDISAAGGVSGHISYFQE